VARQLTQPVEFPAATAFDLAPAVVVPMVATMEACWAAAPGNPYLDVMVAGDANSEQVQTRCATFLPFCCIESCLGPLSMHDLWAAMGQPLVDAGRVQEMSVFLDWICVALVLSAAQAPQPQAGGAQVAGVLQQILDNQHTRQQADNNC